MRDLSGLTDDQLRGGLLRLRPGRQRDEYKAEKARRIAERTGEGAVEYIQLGDEVLAGAWARNAASGARIYLELKGLS